METVEPGQVLAGTGLEEKRHNLHGMEAHASLSLEDLIEEGVKRVGVAADEPADGGSVAESDPEEEDDGV